MSNSRVEVDGSSESSTTIKHNNEAGQKRHSYKLTCLEFFMCFFFHSPSLFIFISTTQLFLSLSLFQMSSDFTFCILTTMLMRKWNEFQISKLKIPFVCVLYNSKGICLLLHLCYFLLLPFAET